MKWLLLAILCLWTGIATIAWFSWRKIALGFQEACEKAKKITTDANNNTRTALETSARWEHLARSAVDGEKAALEREKVALKQLDEAAQRETTALQRETIAHQKLADALEQLESALRRELTLKKEKSA